MSAPSFPVSVPSPDMGDAYLPIGVYISLDEGWTYDGRSVQAPSSGTDQLDLWWTQQWPPVGPHEIPPNPNWFAVVVAPDTASGIYTGKITVFAHNDADFSQASAQASFTIHVVGGQGPAAVPEPSSALLLALGAVGLGYRRARRRG